jgi:hypothetical protein
MKATILIIGLSVGLMGQALAQTNQPVSPSEVTNAIASGVLVTKLGTVYHGVHLDTVLKMSGETVPHRQKASVNSCHEKRSEVSEGLADFGRRRT